MTAATRDYNCPSCGAALDPALRYAKVVACAHCDSMVLLADDALRLAGKQGVMADMPSLLALHQPFCYRKQTYTPIGHARFDYAHGWWDEWWTVAADGPSWISVDEGEIAVEQPIELKQPPDRAQLQLGNRLRLDYAELVVTEAGQATCRAVRGALPEPLSPGDRFDYWHLSGSGGTLVTVELDGGGWTATRGVWVNPYEIERGTG